jgi:hypothetical protein
MATTVGLVFLGTTTSAGTRITAGALLHTGRHRYIRRHGHSLGAEATSGVCGDFLRSMVAYTRTTRHGENFFSMCTASSECAWLSNRGFRHTTQIEKQGGGRASTLHACNT